MTINSLDISISDSDDENNELFVKPVKYLPDTKYFINLNQKQIEAYNKQYYFVSDCESEDEKKID